jgi:hypothetical protein
VVRDGPEVFLVRVEEGCHVSAVPWVGDASADPSADGLGVHAGLGGKVHRVKA